MAETKRFLIFDSNSLIHRAYHALPPLTTKKGEVVGAVYGFLLVFLRAIKELKPDFVAAAFDVKGPTFRHEQYSGYKAKRVKAPDDLYAQIPIVKEVLKSFGVNVFEKEGFEGDDVIGTLADLAPRKQILPKLETIIVSGDTDTLQLVDDKTKAYILRKGVKDIVLYDDNAVKEKYQGLIPGQLLEYRALKGDPTDNITGVPGIGEKTAIELISQFGTLDSIYENIEKVRPRVKELLLLHKETAYLSRDLSQIHKNVPLEFDLQKCLWLNYDKALAAKKIEELGFVSLIPRLP
jgi:DNA polymerase-1